MYAEEVLKRHGALVAKRAVWEAYWQEIAEFVRPIRAQVTERSSSPSTEDYAELFDTTARQANITLAAGQFASVTPLSEKWFMFSPPRALAENDRVRSWYNTITDISHEVLAHSNFYDQIHELYLDRGAFGTAAIYIEEGDRAPVFFRNCPIGSFTLSEDNEGYVDTCFREFRMSARAAAQEYGEEALSERTRKLLGDSAKQDEEICLIHAVYPRRERDPQKRDAINKPYASITVEKDARKVLRHSGYDEMPFAATRYHKWGDSPYGWGPGWVSLPETRQLNFLEKNMDALAEIAAFPRILLPDTQEGEVDLRAAGVSYFDANNPNAVPREWGTQGRYDVGRDRAEMRRRAINEIFYVDLFRLFANIDKQMTAREVAERSSEKLSQFAPIFARMTTELFTPLLGRVYAILIRGGFFPPPPEELLVADGEELFLPDPALSYTSRMAMAIKALQNVAWSRALETAMPLMRVDPTVMDNFNLEAIIRDTARNDGLPERWIRPEEEVAQIRQQRAQAQQQAQAVDAAQKGADALNKFGQVPEDLREQVQGALMGG